MRADDEDDGWHESEPALVDKGDGIETPLVMEDGSCPSSGSGSGA
jgi:hypothetical protein